MTDELLPGDHLPESYTYRHIDEEDDDDQRSKAGGVEYREWHDRLFGEFALPDKEHCDQQYGYNKDSDHIWSLPTMCRCLTTMSNQ